MDRTTSGPENLISVYIRQLRIGEYLVEFGSHYSLCRSYRHFATKLQRTLLSGLETGIISKCPLLQYFQDLLPPLHLCACEIRDLFCWLLVIRLVCYLLSRDNNIWTQKRTRPAMWHGVETAVYLAESCEAVVHSWSQRRWAERGSGLSPHQPQREMTKIHTSEDTRSKKCYMYIK